VVLFFLSSGRCARTVYEIYNIYIYMCKKIKNEIHVLTVPNGRRLARSSADKVCSNRFLMKIDLTGNQKDWSDRCDSRTQINQRQSITIVDIIYDRLNRHRQDGKNDNNVGTLERGRRPSVHTRRTGDKRAGPGDGERGTDRRDKNPTLLMHG